MPSVTYTGTRELISAHSPAELVTNGGFSTDSDWFKGTGWSITGGVATVTSLIQSDLEQAITFTEGLNYDVVYTVSGRTAGTVTAKVKGTSGAAQSTNDTFTETITAGSGLDYIEFTKDSSFDGDIDNVSVMLGENSWDMDFEVVALVKSYDVPKTVHESLDRTTETLADDMLIIFDVKTEYLTRGSTAWLQWMEFLNSVREGETFTFDPYGTAASPDSPNNAKLVGVWNEERIERERFFINFQVRYGANV